ncbi:MAG: TonB-dependent receptor [Alphaproteobacteria bacterium]|nr:TonB-dependent receptor [Alphaproteobacteria bacterium]
MRFKALSLCAAAPLMLWAGAAFAHVTAFDPGVAPGAMQNGQVTLPSGETAPILSKDECEAQKQADESCEGTTGYFIVTPAELPMGITVHFSGDVNGKMTEGTARITSNGALMAEAGSTGSLFSQQGQIETVISQAQKKEESVQDVPVPVTAFSGLAIERHFAVNLEDLNKLAPSVQLQHVGLFHNASSFTVRGIGTSGIESFDDPHVAIFIDGVYQARNAWAISNLLDIEAVEMLRGPQGTIYGRNAYSGAITLRTKKPDTNEYSGKVSLQLGNPGKVIVSFIGNAPVVRDKFAVRIASQFYKDSGFYKNDGVIIDGVSDGHIVTHIDPNLEGKRIEGNKYVYFRPSFRLTPNDKLDITLTTEFIRQRGDGTISLNPTYDPRTPSNPLCGGVGTSVAYNCNTSLMEVLYPGLTKNYFGDGTLGIPGDKSNDPFRVGYSLPYNNSDLNSYNFTLNADYHTDIGTFSLTANYGHQRDLINTDTDGENIDFFSSTRFQAYSTYQVETHFVSDFSDKLDMIAGLFYLWDSYHLGQILWTPGIGKFTYDNPGLSYYQNGQDRKTWAAYTQFEYHFTDQLSAVAGVRYSWEKKYNIFETPNNSVRNQGLDPNSDWSRFPTDSSAPDCDPIGTLGTAAHHCFAYWENKDGATWDNFAPRVGVNFKVNPDILLFAFWQRAFKSGGFVNNAAAYTTFTGSPYGEERIDNFEGGFKTSWMDNRLQVNGNFYYQKLMGLQRQVIRPADNPSGQETFISNNADARSYGFELELTAIPVDGLTLNANLAYNNIKYTNYCADLDGPEPTSTPANGRAVCGAGAQQLPNGTWIVPTDFSNVPLAFAPKVIANFGFTYDFPIGNMGNLSIGSSVNFTSKMATSGVPFPYSDRRALTLLDAQISWESPNSKYRVSIWGKNLTNDLQRLSVTPVAYLFSFEQSTNPRTYGITLTADF